MEIKFNGNDGTSSGVLAPNYVEPGYQTPGYVDPVTALWNSWSSGNVPDTTNEYDGTYPSSSRSKPSNNNTPPTPSFNWTEAGIIGGSALLLLSSLYLVITKR